MSEKTEPPSPRKLREAHRKGQVPRSALLSAAALCTAGAGVLHWTGERSLSLIESFTVRAFSDPSWLATAALAEAGRVAALTLMPSLTALLMVALAVGSMSAGWQLDFSKVSPSLERLDPVAGLARMFSARRLREAAKGAALAVAVLLLGMGSLSGDARALLATPRLEGTRSAWAIGSALESLVARCCVVALVLGAGDLLLARRRHYRDLMMTREEAKREHRESEGDPRQKGQRRALQRQLAAGGPARGVQKATAIVVNPTHIAVALRYDPKECDAPYIVARGRETEALKLKLAARQRGIPVVRDVPLARSLIHYDVGEEIPEELYQAAAVVLRIAAERGPDHLPSETA